MDERTRYKQWGTLSKEVKEAQWAEYFKNAQEEYAALLKSSQEDLAALAATRERLKSAGVCRDLKMSYILAGNKRPHTRVWKNPSPSQLRIEIPKQITHALTSLVAATERQLGTIPTLTSRQKFWKKQLDAAVNKQAYGMVQATQSRKGRVTVMPPLALVAVKEPIPECDDPNHEPGETS